MEKNKNRVFKLLGLLVVVFLVCLCMLGSTFARYTTGGKGTATAGVAEWDVTAPGWSNSTSVTIGKLSPMLKNNSTSESDYSGTGGTKYVNLICNKVATITVTNIDVDAQLQISYTDVKVNGNSSGALGSSSYTTDNTGSWSVDSDSSGITTSDLIANPIWSQVIGSENSALNFYVGYEMYGGSLTNSTASESFTSMTPDSWDDSSVSCYGYNVSKTDITTLTSGSAATTLSATSVSSGASVTIDVYAWVTWTSDYNTYSADVVDAIDTWIGMNVASVSATITCKLVQASTITSQDSNSLN